MRLALGYGSLAAYAASFGCYTWFLYDTRKWIGRVATLCLAAGIVLHYFALLERSRWAHTVPYDDLYGSMSLFAWLLAVTYLALESIHRQRAVGAFLVAFLLLWFAPTLLAMPATVPLPPPARGPLFALHVTIEILAYAAFALSFICSLIYLVQNRVLRARSQGRVFWRFPALDVLERMSRSSVWVGVGALICGSVLGFVWERRISGGYGGHDPKVMITAVILALYCGYLWLADRSGWRGARAARLCAANFLIVLFSYTFVNFYLTAFHRYF